MRAPLGEAFGIGKHVELFDVAPGEVLMGETSRAPVIRAWDPIGPLPACGPSNGSSIDERRGQSRTISASGSGRVVSTRGTIRRAPDFACDSAS